MIYKWKRYGTFTVSSLHVTRSQQSSGDPRIRGPLSQIPELSKTYETTSWRCWEDKIMCLQGSGIITGIYLQDGCWISFLSFLPTFLWVSPFLVCISSTRSRCLNPTHLQSLPSCGMSSTYSNHGLCYFIHICSFPNWLVKISKAWSISHTNERCKEECG